MHLAKQDPHSSVLTLPRYTTLDHIKHHHPIFHTHLSPRRHGRENITGNQPRQKKTPLGALPADGVHTRGRQAGRRLSHPIPSLDGDMSIPFLFTACWSRRLGGREGKRSREGGGEHVRQRRLGDYLMCSWLHDAAGKASKHSGRHVARTKRLCAGCVRPDDVSGTWGSHCMWRRERFPSIIAMLRCIHRGVWGSVVAARHRPAMWLSGWQAR